MIITNSPDLLTKFREIPSYRMNKKTMRSSCFAKGDYCKLTSGTTLTAPASDATDTDRRRVPGRLRGTISLFKLLAVHLYMSSKDTVSQGEK